ncbi:phage major capsid protein [Pseudonocardia hispaniensis]|uniref:Phage major capsid protein n=1 Tax=Pseudonocardia hispaniensis TaxID=904933 RepID=A0ABW1IZ21_9PSEU
MPTSVELRQERARVVESLRAITEAAEAENRNLTAQERESYERHEREFGDLTERITRVEAEERRALEMGQPLDRGTGGGGTGGGGGGGDDRAGERRAAFAQFLRRGRTALAPEQRALVENSDGEILVPEELEAEIIRSLPALTIFRAICSVRTIGSNRVRRRSLGEVSVGWGKLETNAQTLTDSMPGTPTEEYTYVEDLYGLAKIGEDELDDSDVNLEAHVRDSFARALGETEDTAFAIGTGHAAHQPVGMMTTAGGVATVTAAGATAVTVDDFIKLIYAVPAQYRRNGRFVMASATELQIALLREDGATGAYLWQPSVQAGRPNTFKGYAIDNQEDLAAVATAARVAVFGDFNAGYRIYDRLGMAVKVLDQLYAEDGMVGWKVRKRVGGDVIRPDALRILVMA